MSSSSDTADFGGLGQGIIGFVGVLMLVFAALSVTLALKMKTGGNATRVCAIVYGAFATLGGVVSLPSGIVTLALGILIIVFVAKSDGAAWFQRHAPVTAAPAPLSHRRRSHYRLAFRHTEPTPARTANGCAPSVNSRGHGRKRGAQP